MVMARVQYCDAGAPVAVRTRSLRRERRDSQIEAGGKGADASRRARARRAPHAGLFYGDLYKFDPNSSTWTNLSVPAAGEPPSRRYRHGLAAWAGAVYVFGGNYPPQGEHPCRLR